VGTRKHLPQPGTEFEEFFDLSIDLLCIVGLDGYFKRVSASFERTLGYPRSELLSRPVFDITHPDDVEPSREAMARLAEGRDLVGFESRVICADGSVRWLEWNTRTVPEWAVVYGVARDTTERRRAEGELRDAQRQLEASRDQLTVLAEEQAALRRVATLVAHEAAPGEVFAAVGREVGEVLGVEATHLGRYDPDGTVVSVAQWGRYPGVPIGARFPLEGDSVSARVLRTGRPARMDSYEDAPGVIAATIRERGIRYSIGVPISVQGRPWGVMIATSKQAPFPAETESRLQDFTELVATAIANAQARSELRQLVEEQRALRRVATLVARAASQDDVFDVVVQEAYRLFGEDVAFLLRYESDGTPVIAAIRGAPAEFTPGTRFSREGDGVPVRVWRTGRAARLDSYENVSGRDAARARSLGVRGSAGAPIVVAGRVWGVIVVMTRGDALPVATEGRLAQFAELVAAAIANAAARAEVTRLADEQAALRRVATLVAQGAQPSAVFDAVTREVVELLDASAVSLARHEDDVLSVVATSGTASYVQVGGRYQVGGTNVMSAVARTGRTARMDDLAQASGRIGDMARGAGVRSVVGAPVVVDGRIWGVLAAIWSDHGPPPEDTEERMARFAELLDTAIANADGRDQLTASRARVLAASDEARRRVVRDLHDGAQQRLVHTIITLKLAQQAVRDDRPGAKALLAEAVDTAERATAEVRELAHGILPSVLVHSGLRAGIDAFASRLDLPVEVDVSRERLPPDIEASAYFIVAEALTNVVKHARATRATVKAVVEDGALVLEVRDDGVGGADPEGHGLVGVDDRVDALGGRLQIESEAGGGTVLAIRLPLSTGWPRGASGQ
jgi:PAS domain S-box-containing protein